MLKGLRIALVLTIVAALPAFAGKPGKPDCSASLAAVQSAVADACDCATAKNHGQYVRCAGQTVKGMASGGSLPKACRGAMMRVFAKSSCGKADAVTCCMADRPCHVKKASVCERLGGVAGSTPFCADACTPGSPSGAFVD